MVVVTPGETTNCSFIGTLLNTRRRNMLSGNIFVYDWWITSYLNQQLVVLNNKDLTGSLFYSLAIRVRLS